MGHLLSTTYYLPPIVYHLLSTSNTHRISSLLTTNLPQNTISNSPKATTSPTPPNPTPIPITNIQSLPMPLIPIQFKPGSFFTPNPSGSNPLISHTYTHTHIHTYTH